MAQGETTKTDSQLDLYLEQMEALELLVIHLLEEISVPGGLNYAQASNQTLASANPAYQPILPPPIPPSVPTGAKRSFEGTITSLELLRDVKQALISRVEKEQQEVFKKEIQEIEEKIKKLKGEE